MAGDWGAVALVREAGGEIYGDQTLGVRNSLAVIAARDLAVSKVCLPPGRGPEGWQELLQAAPRGSFWGYLYQLPALTVCVPGNLALPSRESGPGGEKLRWIVEDDLGYLCPEAPQELGNLQDWFKHNEVSPPGGLSDPQRPALGPGAGPGPTTAGTPGAASISPAA